jgi:RNA polymerase primary sigma factor
MFGIILTPRGSPATRRRPDIDRVSPLMRWETTSPQYLEGPTRGSPRVRPAAEEPSPALRIFEPESRATRAHRILGMELSYVAHPSFDEPGAHDAILTPMPAPDDAPAPRRTKVSAGMPPYLASLDHEGPLLSREQEAHLFRKMNYLKSRASRLRDQVDPARARKATLDEIERQLEEALAIKDQIIRANLRLVVAIAKRQVGSRDELFERVSDGNYALIRAVDRFDYARGNKFSTYATWAIINSLKLRRRQKNERVRFVTVDEAMLQDTTDTRADVHDQEKAHEQRRCQVECLLGGLDDRERRILVSRYGIGGAEERTLKQIGQALGITKERVRQIEMRARQKLRRLARAEELDLLPA